jgi:hypothetical protein
MWMWARRRGKVEEPIASEASDESDILDKVHEVIGNDKLNKTYEELKKNYDSGLIKPADDCNVVQRVQSNSPLNNILSFIKDRFIL